MKLILLSTLFACQAGLYCLPCEARLNESFQGYKTRVSGESKLIAQNGDNYMFELTLDPQTKSICPGYAAGVTVTVKTGKITGQSLAIRLGNNAYLGSMLSSQQIYRFISEAAGKPLPKDSKQQEQETQPVRQAVTLALMGQAQTLKLAGYDVNVVISRDSGGNLIVGVTEPVLPSPNMMPDSKAR